MGEKTPRLHLIQTFGDLHYKTCPDHLRTSLLQASFVANTSTFQLIGGQHCAKYAKQLGITFVPYLTTGFDYVYHPREDYKRYEFLQNSVCIDRWAKILEQIQPIDTIDLLYQDSDTLLYIDPSSIIRRT